jgi:kinesin family member 6/9
MQIYNEKIYDLLETKADNNNNNSFNSKALPSGPDLKLRLKKNNDFLVENLSVHPITSYNTAINLFQRGVKKKIMDSHKLNLSSSRSHCIFTVYLETEEGNKIGWLIP